MCLCKATYKNPDIHKIEQFWRPGMYDIHIYEKTWT